MHAAGIFHSDLKTCNILVSEDTPQGNDPSDMGQVDANKAPASGKAVRFSLLDYDEVRFFRHVSGRRRIKNLIQIFLSTPVAIKATQRLLFLNEYALHAGLSPYEKRETARVVLEAASGKKILYVGFNGDVREEWDSTPSSGSALQKPVNLSP